MRCFFSIEIPEKIKDEVIKSQLEVKCDSKLVKKEQLHLTLLFLGEVEKEKIEALSEKLSQFKFPSFEVQLKNAGAFPSEKNPRVFWIGVESSEIKKLHDQLKKTVNSLGIETENREFKPHLTLGRVKEKCNLKKWVEQNTKTFGSFNADSFFLKQSVFDKNGVAYETLAKVNLK